MLEGSNLGFGQAVGGGGHGDFMAEADWPECWVDWYSLLCRTKWAAMIGEAC